MSTTAMLVPGTRISQTGQIWDVGAPGRVIIWHPLKPIFFKLLGLGQGWQICLRLYAQIVSTSQSNSFVCGVLSFLEPHFTPFQWHLNASYRLVPPAVAWLASCLVWLSSQSHVSVTGWAALCRALKSQVMKSKFRLCTQLVTSNWMCQRWWEESGAVFWLLTYGATWT
jgi:hypothetical protein